MASRWEGGASHAIRLLRRRSQLHRHCSRLQKAGPRNRTEIAATRPLAHNGRAFWKLTDADSGALAWLAFTRPDARSALARRKVWTLIPYLQVFMANWFVSVDHELTDQSQWIHTNIDVYEARELALLVPQPTAGDMKRITRPEAVLTLDDIDRHKVTTVLGKGTAQAMRARR